VGERAVDAEKINNWVQTTTGVAIVIGLVLVVWELQQSREAVRTQLASDGYQIASQVRTAVMGEHTAAVLAKACDKPSELTRAELHVLDNYYLEQIGGIRRVQTLTERGSFYTEDQVAAVVGTLDVLIESAAGRAYLRTGPFQRLRPIIDERISEWDGPDCAVFFDNWENNIMKELE